MKRRDLMIVGGALASGLATGAKADTRPTTDLDARPKVIRVFNTPDGESHLEVIEVQPTAKPLEGTVIRVNAYKPAKVDWHKVPQPQFTINITGQLEVEVSSGQKKRIGPGDLVYLEDSVGKGHITHLLSPVTNLFIRVPPGFDLLAWAKGAP